MSPVRGAPARGTGPQALLLWLGLAGAAAAQDEPLVAGREARLFVRGVIAPFEGTLTSANPETLTLTLRDGSVFTLRAEQIQRSEVLGTRRNAVRGGLFGGALGVAVGVVLLVSSRNDCAGQPSGYCDDFGTAFDPWHLVVPPLAGAAAGAGFGYFVRTPRWAPGLLPGALPSDGVSLGLGWSVPFGPLGASGPSGA